MQRTLRAKGESAAAARSSSRPTDGRTNERTERWMDDGWTKRGIERKQGAHRYARVRRAATATMADHCLLPAAAPTHHPSLHLKRADGGAEAGGGTEIKSMRQNARQSQHNQPQPLS